MAIRCYDLDGRMEKVYHSYIIYNIDSGYFTPLEMIAAEDFDYEGGKFTLIEENRYNISGLRVYKKTSEEEYLYYQTPFGYLGRKDVASSEGENRYLINYINSQGAATYSFESSQGNYATSEGAVYSSKMNLYNGENTGLERAALNNSVPVTVDMQPLCEIEGNTFSDTSSDQYETVTVSAESYSLTGEVITANYTLIAKIEVEDVLVYHRDQIGSIRAVTRTTTEGSIEIVWDGDYKPFGELLTDSTDNEWLPLLTFALHEHDLETGLIYAKQRWLDPTTGQFLQEDPIMDGLNWYTYCGGNPMGAVDPSGLRPNYAPTGLSPSYPHSSGSDYSTPAARDDRIREHFEENWENEYKDRKFMIEGHTFSAESYQDLMMGKLKEYITPPAERVEEEEPQGQQQKPINLDPDGMGLDSGTFFDIAMQLVKIFYEEGTKYYTEHSKEIYDYLKENGIKDIKKLDSEKIIKIASDFISDTGIIGKLSISNRDLSEIIVWDIVFTIGLNATCGFVGGFIDGLHQGFEVTKAFGQVDGPLGEIMMGVTEGIESMLVSIWSGTIQALSLYGHNEFGFMDLLDSTATQVLLASAGGYLSGQGGPADQDRIINALIAAGSTFIGYTLSRGILEGQIKWIPGE